MSPKLCLEAIIIYKNYSKKSGKVGVNRVNDFWVPLKSMKIWVGTNNLVFCSGQNLPTLSWHLHKRYVVCRERGILQARHPLLLLIMEAFHIITWQPRGCSEHLFRFADCRKTVYRGFEHQSGQTKDYKIGICSLSTKHAASRRKSEFWLARN